MTRLGVLGIFSKHGARIGSAWVPFVPRVIGRIVVVLSLGWGLSGCAALASGWQDVPQYYWQSVRGHLAVMSQARPIEEVIRDTSTDPALRHQLRLAREIRAFAAGELGLPDNPSYTQFAQLDRPFVLWNVFATNPLSVRLKTWCFPVAGCVGYRGYYRRDDAEAFAERLRAQGLEVYVGGVPAYSTLGWMNDPLVSTFIRYPQAELARLIFHELSHQVAYASGDTTFNESYAAAVEEIGVERWFAMRPDDAALRAFREQSLRRRNFVALLVRHKDMLAKIYGESFGDRYGEGDRESEGQPDGLPDGVAGAVSGGVAGGVASGVAGGVPSGLAADLSLDLRTDEGKRRAKQRVLDGLRRDYLALRATWGGYPGFDRWFTEPLTNAHLAAIGAYADLLPAFRVLFAECGQRLPDFHAAVKRLAALPRTERDLRMQRWMQISSGHLFQGDKDGSVLAQELPQGRSCGD